MPDTRTLYKLIILKMLSRMGDAPLTNAQITGFILEMGYTGYFTVQQVLSEMTEAGLVSVSSNYSSSFYRITDSGADTLNLLKDRISGAICKDIETYLAGHRMEFYDALSVTADYFLGENQEYTVCCMVREKDSTLMGLTLCVPSKNQAESICNHWKQKSQQIYSHIMKELL